MSKQMRLLDEAFEAEQREKDIIRLLDEAYEVETQEQVYKAKYYRDLDNRVARAQADIYTSLEYGYLAS